MNRSTILILVLSSWVLAACGGSSFSVEEPHHEDDHAEHDDHDDDHGHDHDDDHGHGHEEEMYEQLQSWLDMRDDFRSEPPMPEPPANMMVSVGTPPVTASWSGDIDGTINPSYSSDYSDPEIELTLDEHADMHGNVYVHTDSDEHKLVHHLDAEDVTGSSFESPADHENRMTGTFYGDDHGTIVGTVDTAIVIGTYQAEKNGDDH